MSKSTLLPYPGQRHDGAPPGYSHPWDGKTEDFDFPVPFGSYDKKTALLDGGEVMRSLRILRPVPVLYFVWAYPDFGLLALLAYVVWYAGEVRSYFKPLLEARRNRRTRHLIPVSPTP